MVVIELYCDFNGILGERYEEDILKRFLCVFGLFGSHPFLEECRERVAKNDLVLPVRSHDDLSVTS